MAEAKTTPEAPNRPIRILSIDGGGVRGAIPARILVELEAITGRPISSLFDLVAGTSTGALIGLGAVRPDASGTKPAMTATQILDIYLKDTPKMFPAVDYQRLIEPTYWRGNRADVYQRVGALVRPRRFGNARYRAKALEGAVTRSLGDSRLADALVDIVIPSYDWKAGRSLVFRSRTAKTGEGPNPFMRDVARGTTAAPTYFPPVKLDLDDGREVVLIDGGIVAMNPISVAYNEGLFLEAQAGRDLDFLIVSLGTGRPPEAVPTYEELWSRGWLQLGMGMLGVVFDGTAEIADELVRSIVAKREPHSRVWRLQAELHGCTLRLDDASPKNLHALLGIADRLIVDNRDVLKEMAAMLVADVPADGPAPAATA